MATTLTTNVFLPSHVLSEGDDGTLRFPPDIHTLKGFHRWLRTAKLPEKAKVHFVAGEVFIDMSEESIQTHVLVKKAIFQMLPNLMDDEDLGEFYPDGILVTNNEGPISNNPDGVAVLWESIEAGRVKFGRRRKGSKKIQKEQETRLRGTPDWIMEIVSRSSVRKDKKDLRKAYHRAGIREYWLIDARGKEIDFQILHWQEEDYSPAETLDGWQFSKVFNRYFRLTRKRNRRDGWQYKLEAKSA